MGGRILRYICNMGHEMQNVESIRLLTSLAMIQKDRWEISFS